MGRNDRKLFAWLALPALVVLVGGCEALLVAAAEKEPWEGDLTGRWRDSNGDSMDLVQRADVVHATAASAHLEQYWTAAEGSITGSAIRMVHTRAGNVTDLVNGIIAGDERIDWDNGTHWVRESKAQPVDLTGGPFLTFGGVEVAGADTTTPIPAVVHAAAAASAGGAPGAGAPAARSENTESRTLDAGIHFFRRQNGAWLEVTKPDEIREMTNTAEAPTKSVSGRNEDWYLMHLERAKRYRFAATSTAFDPKIGYAYTLPRPVGNNWSWPEFGADVAVLGDTSDFQPGFTGEQWVVVTTRFSPSSPGPSGAYDLEFTTWSGQGPAGTYGEASEVALLHVPRLNQRTTLIHLNFDGFAGSAQNPDGTAITTYTYDPFDASVYLAGPLKAAKDTEGVIQHVIYKTAEIYSPFDVAITRRRGKSSYATSFTDSTIFIGDDVNRSDTYALQHQTVSNYDFGNKKTDIGWVDHRTSSGAISWQQMVRWIAHEAGHTFGLIHVRTSGSDRPAGTDFATWAANNYLPRIKPASWNTSDKPEVMSYDSDNSVFVQHAFDITGWNNEKNGLVLREWLYPTFKTSTILTQSSKSYLMGVVGGRGLDPIANVADRRAILQRWDEDAIFLDSVLPNREGIGPANQQERDLVAQAGRAGVRALVASRPDLVNAADLASDRDYATVPSDGAIERQGDYDVFLLGSPGGVRKARCTPKPGSQLDPVVLVYDVTGKELLAYDDDSAGNRGALATLRMDASKKYKVVVGAKDGLTTGAYELRLE